MLNNKELPRIFYGLSVYDLLVHLCTTGLSMYDVSFRAGGTKFAWGVVLQGMPTLEFFQKYGSQKRAFLHFGYCFAKRPLKPHYHNSCKKLIT